jgi:hypothetical protein
MDGGHDGADDSRKRRSIESGYPKKEGKRKGEEERRSGVESLSQVRSCW